MDEAAAIFDAYRPGLLRVAYRMLGSMTDAEDVVQDAFLRWARADRAAVEVPAAFLRRIVSRLCLDQLKSARAQRESYFGPWLPEPILTGETPATVVGVRETISTAFLVILATVRSLRPLPLAQSSDATAT